MNPFSLPNNDPELYHQREYERIEEERLRQELRQIPIEERHLAIAEPTVLSQIKDLDSTPTLPPIEKPKVNYSSKKETIREFIQRKREILLVKKNIQNKKERTKYLDQIIKAEEETHKNNVRMLEDNVGRVDRYEEQLKHEAERRTAAAEKKNKTRIEKQHQINNLVEQIQLKKSKTDRLSEEMKTLEQYKQFVDEIIPSEEHEEDPGSTYITEAQSKAFAKTPAQFLEAISAFEENNLFLIENSQEAEQELEALKLQNQNALEEVNKKLTEISNKITTIKQQKQTLESKRKELSTDKEEEQEVEKETMILIHSQLCRIYEDLGGDSSNNPSPLEMLETIEATLESYLKKRATLDLETLKKLEREIDKKRRHENVVLEQQRKEKARQEMNEKIEKRKQRVVKKTGRPNMTRSKLPEKQKVVVKPVEPQEVKDWREFLEEEKPELNTY